MYVRVIFNLTSAFARLKIQPLSSQFLSTRKSLSPRVAVCQGTPDPFPAADFWLRLLIFLHIATRTAGLAFSFPVALWNFQYSFRSLALLIARQARGVFSRQTREPPRCQPAPSLPRKQLFFLSPPYEHVFAFVFFFFGKLAACF